MRDSRLALFVLACGLGWSSALSCLHGCFMPVLLTGFEGASFGDNLIEVWPVTFVFVLSSVSFIMVVWRSRKRIARGACSQKTAPNYIGALGIVCALMVMGVWLWSLAPWGRGPWGRTVWAVAIGSAMPSGVGIAGWLCLRRLHR